MKMYPEDGQAELLQAGLTKMVDGFAACLCPVCGGAGEYRQMFTAGCGRGYYHSMSMCDYCKGEGLLVNGKEAPESVCNQVRTAAVPGKEDEQ